MAESCWRSCRNLETKAHFFCELLADNGYNLLVGVGRIGCVQYSPDNGNPPYLMACPIKTTGGMARGCGSDCLMMVVVDAQAGRVFAPPMSGVGTELYVSMDMMSDREIDFRLDSSLMILRNARREARTECGVHYFNRTGQRLDLMKRPCRLDEISGADALVGLAVVRVTILQGYRCPVYESLRHHFVPGAGNRSCCPELFARRNP